MFIHDFSWQIRKLNKLTKHFFTISIIMVLPMFDPRTVIFQKYSSLMRHDALTVYRIKTMSLCRKKVC